jgi:hypothetical protein
MAQPLVVIVPHRLGKEAAKQRLRGGVTQLRDKLAMFGASAAEEVWSGDEMRFRVSAFGQTATGRVEITETTAIVEVDLPGLLGWFGKRIAERVSREGTLLLEKK